MSLSSQLRHIVHREYTNVRRVILSQMDLFSGDFGLVLGAARYDGDTFEYAAMVEAKIS